jgi:hypothetical protein
MKKRMKHLMSVLMVLLACLTCPACSSDDDDDSDKELSVKEQLIGTWEYVGEWYYGERETNRYTFNADGTGYVTETYEYTAAYTGEKEDSDIDYFIWSYEEQTQLLKMIFDKGGDEDLDIYLLSEIASNKITAYWVDSETMEVDYSDHYLLSKVK